MASVLFAIRDIFQITLKYDKIERRKVLLWEDYVWRMVITS
jgi:hypothetical protein